MAIFGVTMLPLPPKFRPQPDSNDQDRLARAVADTLKARRAVGGEHIAAKGKGIPTNTSIWNDLMRREQDARVANDSALSLYRLGPAVQRLRAVACRVCGQNFC